MDHTHASRPESSDEQDRVLIDDCNLTFFFFVLVMNGKSGRFRKVPKPHDDTVH
jgi:hypothetical protein